MSVSELFRAIRNETALPRYDTPDPKIVAQTSDRHPGTQCRLDTYFSGARPLCWYKPPADEQGGLVIEIVEPAMLPALTRTDLWTGL